MKQTLEIRSYYTPEFEAREGHVFEQATHVFGNQERARRWLETTKWRFEGRTPIQMLRTSDGVLQVEALLGQIDASIFA